jgi:type II secretory pathway component PulC
VPDEVNPEQPESAPELSPPELNQESQAEAEAEAEAEADTDAEADADAQTDRQRANGQVESGEETQAEDRAGVRGETTLGASVDAAEEGGLRIGTVSETGLAADAGLREGDVITSVDGQEFSTHGELDAYLRDRGDQRVPITIVRDGQEQQMLLETRTRRQAQADMQGRPALGVTLRNGADGVIVSRVMPGSPAERAGLRASDRIVTLNGVDVAANDDFLNVMEQVQRDGDSELFFIRNGQRYQATFRPAPWDQVFVADSGQTPEFRQTLRPDLAPPPPNGQDRYSVPPVYNGRGEASGTYYRGGFDNCRGFQNQGGHFQNQGGHFQNQGGHFQNQGGHFQHQGGHFQNQGGYFQSQGGYYDASGRHFGRRGAFYRNNDDREDYWEDRFDD